MVTICKDLEELKKEMVNENNSINLDKFLALDFPFLDNEEKFTLISIPSYHDQKHNAIYVNKKTIAFSGANLDNIESKFNKLLKKKHAESTIVIFLILKHVLKNYSQEFEKIRDIMNKLDFDPAIDAIEDSGRALRKLTDRMEGLLQIIIELKERDIEAFDTTLIPFDYEMLNTETRYWLERCRSHIYRVASLRTKSEMKSNKELNDTMKKLTVIMTFLTIAGIVVNVPGTVGAIFGIPALSNAYFEGHTTLLVITLLLTTTLSILLGYLYWKSLRLKSP